MDLHPVGTVWAWQKIMDSLDVWLFHEPTPPVSCHLSARQSKLAKQGDVFARMAIVEAKFTIGKTWDRDGHHHKVIDRKGNAVLVAKDLRGHPGRTSYEVALVRFGESFTVGGRTMPAGERYPASEQWGTRGWTYPDLESAQARFRSVS